LSRRGNQANQTGGACAAKPTQLLPAPVPHCTCWSRLQGLHSAAWLAPTTVTVHRTRVSAAARLLAQKVGLHRQQLRALRVRSRLARCGGRRRGRGLLRRARVRCARARRASLRPPLPGRNFAQLARLLVVAHMAGAVSCVHCAAAVA